MTQRDPVIKISEETGQIQQKVLEVVQRTLDLISESLAARETVELRNFGVFELRLHSPRQTGR
jgi:nucleoid DNA-binding protein